MRTSLHYQSHPKLVHRKREVFYFGSSNVKLELDFNDEEAGTPQVSRNALTIKPKGKQALKWLMNKKDKIIKGFVKKNANSRYGLLNCRIADLFVSIKDPQWPGFVDKKKGDRKLQKIEFPSITSLPWKYSSLPGKLQYRGKAVTVLTSVGTKNQTSHYEGISGIGLSFCPDKVLQAEKTYRLFVAPLWEKSPYSTCGQTILSLKTASFPPKWKGIVGIHFAEDNNITIWNKASPILKHVREDDWKWAIEHSNQIDPLAISDVLLKDRERAIAWVLNFASITKNKNIWNALPERSPEFLKKLWRIVFNLSYRSRIFKPIVFWVDDASDSRLRELSPSGCNVYSFLENSDVVEKYLPDPGEKWKLVSVEEKPERLKRVGGAKTARRHRKRKPLKKKGAKRKMAKKLKRKAKVKK